MGNVVCPVTRRQRDCHVLDYTISDEAETSGQKGYAAFFSSSNFIA